ncbi:MAG: coenzyme F420-0:L-glutamate ligase [Chloroflexota bacterium]
MTDLHQLTVAALPDIPLVKPGDDITTIILRGLDRAKITLADDDIIVIASKIVSKAEGRIAKLSDVTPSEEAVKVAEKTRKDARVVQLVLDESVSISRMAPGVLVTQHRLGFVSANAGIDQSNVSEDRDDILLLPENPDETAHQIVADLYAHSGARVAVVISDSHGRPFRMGNIGVAIGLAGMPGLLDLRGQPDLFGRELKISLLGFGDLVASAAHLLSGEGNEGRPVVLLRGLSLERTDGNAGELNRPAQQDLYR